MKESRIARIILFIILGFIILLTIIFVLYGRENRKKLAGLLLPELKVAEVTIKSFSRPETELIVDLMMNNMLPADITADSLSYKIYIGNSKVVEDRYKETISLTRGDSAKISLPVRILNADLIRTLRSLESGNADSVTYTMDLKFYSKTIFKKNFEYSLSKKLPLLYQPEVSVSDFNIGSLNFKEAVINLKVNILNKNNFAVKLKDVAYEFSIEDGKWVKGTLPGVIDIKKEGVTSLDLPVSFSIKDFSKTAFDLLKDPANLRYKLGFSCMIVSENGLINGTKLEVKSNDRVEAVIEARREG